MNRHTIPLVAAWPAIAVALACFCGEASAKGQDRAEGRSARGSVGDRWLSARTAALPFRGGPASTQAPAADSAAANLCRGEGTIHVKVAAPEPERHAKP